MVKWLIAEPEAGLCNRINTLKYAYHLAEMLNCKLFVIWDNSPGEIACDFRDIFVKKDCKVLNLRWPNKSLKVLKQKKQWGELIYELIYRTVFPHIYKCINSCLKKNECILENKPEHQSIDDYIEMYEQKFKTRRGRFIYYHSWINPTKSKDYSKIMFQPDLIKKAESLLGNDRNSIIGIHIRRTDHIPCIDYTSVNDFVKKMKTIQKENQVFYVSTDDAEVIVYLKSLFGNCILYNESCIRGRKEAGSGKDAVVDLLALSKTERIIGSRGSTFSIVASLLEDIPLEWYYKETDEWKLYEHGISYFGG